MRYESDYVLRMIEQMGILLRRAAAHTGGAGEEQAYELAQEVVGLALDMDPDVVARLSAESLKSLLDLRSLDDRILELVAQALVVEANALESGAEVTASRLRREQALAVRSLMDPTRGN